MYMKKCFETQEKWHQEYWIVEEEEISDFWWVSETQGVQVTWLSLQQYPQNGLHQNRSFVVGHIILHFFRRKNNPDM